MKSILIFIAVLTSFSTQLYSKEEVDTIWTRQLNQIHDAKITPDGQKVVVSTDEGIYILDAESGEQLHHYETQRICRDIEISSDGKEFYTTDLYKRNLENYSEFDLLHYDKLFSPNGLAVDPVRSRIIFANCGAWDWDNRIRIFNTETLEKTDSINFDYCLKSIKISQDGSYIAISGSENKVDYTDYLLLLLDSEFNLIKEVYRDSSISVSDMEFTSDSESLFFIARNYYEYNIQDEQLDIRTNVEKGYTRFMFSKSDEYIISSFFINDYNLKVMRRSDFEDATIFSIRTPYIWDIDAESNFLSGDQYNLHMLNLYTILSVEESLLSKFSYNLYQNRIRLELNEQSGTWNITLSDILGNVYYNKIHTGGENINVPYSEIQSPYLLLILDNNGERSVIKIFRGE